MADIELVIKLPEDYYEIIKHDVDKGMDYLPCVLIAKGTPLPKGHGRLIDADKYLKSVCTYKETGCGSCKLQTTCPADAPTIIEADKESEEK